MLVVGLGEQPAVSPKVFRQHPPVVGGHPQAGPFGVVDLEVGGNVPEPGGLTTVYLAVFGPFGVLPQPVADFVYPDEAKLA